MRLSLRSSIPAAALGALLLFPSRALAHIDLIEPNARAHGTAASGDMAVDANTNQKLGPCGQATNMRTSDRVTTYSPGETITVRVREETPHDSYIRVSIDLEGDDSFPTRPIMSTPAETQEQAQAAEDALDTEGTLLAVVRENNNTANFVHEIDVTLPDETCDTCTLQVIQFMYGAAGPYYFQCADIVIAEGGADAGSPAGSGGTAAQGGSGGAGGAGGAGGSVGTNGGASGSTAAGASGEGGSGMPSGQGGTITNTDGFAGDDSCAVGSVPTTRSPYAPLASLLGLGLVGLARRRQPRQ
jgi:MYXO-CTERM domain-containing protein